MGPSPSIAASTLPGRPVGPAPAPTPLRPTPLRPTPLLDPAVGLDGGDGPVVASAGTGVRTDHLSARVRAAASITIAFTCRGTGEIDIRLAGKKIVWGQCSPTGGGVIRGAGFANPSLRRVTTIEVVAKPSSQWRMAYSTGRTAR